MPVTKIKCLFTKWYAKQGYTFGYDFTDVPIIGDDILKIPMGMPGVVFNCPAYVKPLLIYFSPSIYFNETWGKTFIDGFTKGIQEGLEENLHE